MKYLAILLLFFSFISNAQIIPGLEPEEHTISCNLGDGETLILTYDRFEIESKFFVIKSEEFQLGQREKNDCVETHTYATFYMTHYKFSYRDLTEVLKAKRGDLCNLMEKKLSKSEETVRGIGEMEEITCKKEATENCGPKGPDGYRMSRSFVSRQTVIIEKDNGEDKTFEQILGLDEFSGNGGYSVTENDGELKFCF